MNWNETVAGRTVCYFLLQISGKRKVLIYTDTIQDVKIAERIIYDTTVHTSI